MLSLALCIFVKYIYVIISVDFAISWTIDHVLPEPALDCVS